MIGQQKKMRLDEIQVKSFITALSEDELLNTLRGGTDDEDYSDSDDSSDGNELEARPRRRRRSRTIISSVPIP